VQSNSANEVYLTSAQIRRRYGNLSNVTIWRWVRAGKIPQPIKIGRRLLFNLRALEAREAERECAAKDVA
jgi:predicted DNA-binding transcriptional regulator AlpA